MAKHLTGLIIAGALLGVQTLLLLGAWAELPEQVAVHFGSSGAPDGWGTRDALVRISASVSGVVVVFMHLPALFLPRLSASMLRIPNKAWWLAPERADETYARLRGAMLRVGNLSLAAAVFFTAALIDANLDPEQHMTRWLVPVAFGYIGAIIIWAGALRARFDRPNES